MVDRVDEQIAQRLSHVVGVRREHSGGELTQLEAAIGGWPDPLDELLHKWRERELARVNEASLARSCEKQQVVD